MGRKKPKPLGKLVIKPSPRKLRVIPESYTQGRSVLHQTEGTLFFRGAGKRAPDLCCGSCGVVLATGVPVSKIVSLVLHCANCGCLNDAGDAAAVN
jgi:hypothetical protein